MKCPHCNQEHPDDYQFCPQTGEKIELLKACMNNPACPDHGKYIWPSDTRFCPRCSAILDDYAGIKEDSDGKDFKPIIETEPVIIVDEPGKGETKEILVIAKQKHHSMDTGIAVYSNKSGKVFEKKVGWLDSLSIKWASSKKKKKCLFISENDFNGPADVICFDGQVERIEEKDYPWNVLKSFESFDEKIFLRNHSEYYKCVKPNQVVTDEYIILGYRSERRKSFLSRRKSFVVDVWNNDGELLCTLANDTTVFEVFPSGLLVIVRQIGENEGVFGIITKKGETVLPCKYERFYNGDDGDSPFAEEEPNVIFAEGLNEDDNAVYLSVNSGKTYDMINEDFFIKKDDDSDGGEIWRFFDKESEKEICCIRSVARVVEDYELDEGCRHLRIRTINDDYFNYIVTKTGLIQLEEEEDEYDLRAANGFNDDHDIAIDFLKNCFIGEDRIITYKFVNGDCVDSDENTENELINNGITIYDYSGRVIKQYSYDQLPLLIKSPFQFGKALCFKIVDKTISLWYLDLDGNEHEIPNNDGLIIDSYYKTNVFMASEDEFVINFVTKDSHEFGEIRNLDGDVSFKSKSWIKPLGNYYLTYNDIKEGRCGVVDAKGNLVVPPQFDEYELVEYSNGKYLCHDQYGYCNEI